MRILMFYHSVLSDWNHGNAHFLRGIARDLTRRGNRVEIFEPQDAWSLQNLVTEQGWDFVHEFESIYPELRYHRYDLESLDLENLLEGADLVLVHEWNSPHLIAKLGELRRQSGHFRLLFHDTHHRVVTEFETMRRYDLRHYDGVLAFGEVLTRIYRTRGLAEKVWTWHEAADIHLFRPFPEAQKIADLVWIGNWGDEERTAELSEFLVKPVEALKIPCNVHGVRYPDSRIETLQKAGIRYLGWIPNYRVPQTFARHRVTVHIPRRPYVESLPGIPTIRVFEALACGIPLICAPWQDSEHLFHAGRDYLVAKNGREMRTLLKQVLGDREFASELSRQGRKTILAGHTCGHRVEELLRIVHELRARDLEPPLLIGGAYA